jgi:hypothetical protein
MPNNWAFYAYRQLTHHNGAYLIAIIKRLRAKIQLKHPHTGPKTLVNESGIAVAKLIANKCFILDTAPTGRKSK